jgi:hypothetical protein
MGSAVSAERAKRSAQKWGAAARQSRRCENDLLQLRNGGES